MTEVSDMIISIASLHILLLLQPFYFFFHILYRFNVFLLSKLCNDLDGKRIENCFKVCKETFNCVLHIAVLFHTAPYFLEVS